MTTILDPAGCSLFDLAAVAGIPLATSADPRPTIRGAASLETAEPWHLAYMDDPRYAAALRATRAGACVVADRFVDLVPISTVALVSREPQVAYARMLARLHPDLMRPGPHLAEAGATAGAFVHPSAHLGLGVSLDPTVVVGAGARLGANSKVGAHSVIGPDVSIGQDCSIGSGVTLLRCDVGSRAIIHAGVRIGQDGFDFASTAEGHVKIAQGGRVLIGNDVEIGANTTIDRGSGRDTEIGNGTKIDNLVQVGHNVRIGRHCLIVAQVGIAGSTVLEDLVAVGGRSAIAGHLRIGRGAKLAACSGVMRDVPPGERWGGMPAKPLRTWFREQIALQNLALRAGSSEPATWFEALGPNDHPVDAI